MSGYNSYRLSSDTTEEAERLFFELLAKKTAADKLRMVARMNAAVRALAMAGLRERHPDASEPQLRIKFVELMYGSEIAEQIAERLNSFHQHE